MENPQAKNSNEIMCPTGCGVVENLRRHMDENKGKHMANLFAGLSGIKKVWATVVQKENTKLADITRIEEMLMEQLTYLDNISMRARTIQDGNLQELAFLIKSLSEINNVFEALKGALKNTKSADIARMEAIMMELLDNLDNTSKLLQL